MWPNLQKTADLVTFTEEIFNGKLHFLCSGKYIFHYFLKQESLLSPKKKFNFYVTLEDNMKKKKWRHFDNKYCKISVLLVIQALLETCLFWSYDGTRITCVAEKRQVAIALPTIYFWTQLFEICAAFKFEIKTEHKSIRTNSFQFTVQNITKAKTTIPYLTTNIG